MYGVCAGTYPYSAGSKVPGDTYVPVSVDSLEPTQATDNSLLSWRASGAHSTLNSAGSTLPGGPERVQ